MGIEEDFSEEELEFLEKLFNIIGVCAGLLVNEDSTLHVDIDIDNNLVDISAKGEANDN